MKFTRDGERASYCRSSHGSFILEAPPKKRSCGRCCCRVFIGFIVLLLLLFFIGLITWLVVKPKYPSVEMRNIAISSMKVDRERDGTHFKALLSMKMTANVTAINPNRFRVTYGATVADVSYKGMFLGNSSVPAIDQPARSNHTMSLVLVMDKFDVMKGTGLSLLKDAASNAIPFTVVGTVRARIHLLGTTSPLLKVKLTCEIVVHPTEHILLSKHCKSS